MMKTFFEKSFLFLLFLLLTVSCSKEEVIPEVSMPYVPEGNYDLYALVPYINKNLLNIECLGVYSTNDTAFFAGLKNNHIWIKSIKFDRNKDFSNWNTTLFEYEDVEKTDKSQSLQLAYGEYASYEILTLKCIDNTILNDECSLIHLMIKGTPTNSIGSFYTTIKLIFFKNKDHVKQITKKDQHVIDIQKWFDDSFLISYKKFYGEEVNHVFFSEKGDSLYVSKNHSSQLFGYNVIHKTPISYEQTILILENKIQRKDCKENIILWSTNLKSPFNEPINSKYTYSLLEKGNDIWKYKVNIVYMDGTKKEYQFKININDGVVTLID